MSSTDAKTYSLNCYSWFMTILFQISTFDARKKDFLNPAVDFNPYLYII